MSTPAAEVVFEAGAQAAVAAATAPPAAPPAKTPADLAREAIYAKSDARHAPQEADGNEPRPDLRRIMEAEAQGIPFHQLPAEPPAAPSAPARTATPVTPAAPAAPLAQIPEMVSIRVEGRELAVPAADVIRAGVASLQKESSADIRLQRVTLAEQALLAERARLDARAAEIERATTPRGAAQPAGGASLPSGGQPKPAGIRKALEALLDSDVDGAATALGQAVTEQVEARLANGGAARPHPSPAPAAGTIPAPWSQQEINHANTLFERAYGDILNNPAALATASARMAQEMANPVNRIGRIDLVAVADRIGQEMRRSVTPAPAPQPSANSADELAARRSLAARIPASLPLAAVRSVGPAPGAPAFPSRSEQVAAMRKARGQG